MFGIKALNRSYWSDQGLLKRIAECGPACTVIGRLLPPFGADRGTSWSMDKRVTPMLIREIL